MVEQIMGDEDEGNKKSMVFVNMTIPYEFKTESILLGCPRTDKIQQLLIQDTYLVLKDLHNDTEQKYRLQSLAEIFEKCHTVVIPDSMFLAESSIFKTAAFLDNRGPDRLRSFFRKGGNVIIMCMEGSFSVTQEINDVFWTDWHVRLIERGEISPTHSGQDLLQGYLPCPLLDDKGYFVEAPPEEGIYESKRITKGEFMENFKAQDETFEDLGIEPDESMNCFNPEKSWQSHLARYKNRFCVAVHQGSGPSGKVVWYGDKSHTEQMAYVFLKILNLGGEKVKLDMTPLERNGKRLSMDIPMQEITVHADSDLDDDEEDGPESTGLADVFCKLMAGW